MAPENVFGGGGVRTDDPPGLFFSRPSLLQSPHHERPRSPAAPSAPAPPCGCGWVGRCALCSSCGYITAARRSGMAGRLGPVPATQRVLFPRPTTSLKNGDMPVIWSGACPPAIRRRTRPGGGGGRLLAEDADAGLYRAGGLSLRAGGPASRAPHRGPDERDPAGRWTKAHR